MTCQEAPRLRIHKIIMWLCIVAIPLYHFGQLYQAVPEINDMDEFGLEQISLPIFLGWFLRFHVKKLQDFVRLMMKFLQF